MDDSALIRAHARTAQAGEPARGMCRAPRPQAQGAAAPRVWTVYIVEASDNTLYTGVSTDPQRRFAEHGSSPRGARFFRGRRPRALVYTEAGHTRSSACRREAEIKRWSRDRKLALIANAGTADERSST